MKKSAKVVHALESPFPDIAWPAVSKEHEQTITKLLCSLLTPIGDHRRQHVNPSRGRGRIKRKRKHSESGEEKSEKEVDRRPPATPQISRYVHIGFNSTVRVLQWWSTIPKRPSFTFPVRPDQTESQSQPAPLVAIFVCRSSLPAMLTASIPLLTATASVGHGDKPPVRLIALPEEAEAMLTSALHVARVGFVGICEGAPGAESLVEAVRACVPPIEASVLGLEPRYRAVQIRSSETVSNRTTKGDKAIG